MESCKKRWKYLRERYVQQKKVGDSPSYEHLSRPYLEKMKFLDNYIQSRKSYRHVGLFSTPSVTTQAFDGNDSSKSNGSLKMAGSHLGNESDDTFPQYYNLNQFAHANLSVKSEENGHPVHETLKADFHINNMPSSSSSIISQESPATILSNSTANEIDETSELRKRRRSNSIIETNNLHMNVSHLVNESHQKQILNHLSDDNDEGNSINNDDGSTGHRSPAIPNDFLYPFYQQTTRTRKSAEHMDAPSTPFPNPAEFLHPFYQHAVASRQFRNSDQLLGELVTSELIKMTKDKKKIVQKKILEILFFDDE